MLPRFPSPYTVHRSYFVQPNSEHAMPLSLSSPSAAMAAPLPRFLSPSHPSRHVPRLACAPTPHVRAAISINGTIAEEDEEGNRWNSFHLEAPARPRGGDMPRHVAVIMDGNRRWARARGLPVDSGYEAGLRSLRAVVDTCCKLGIEVLTVFAFSMDNWLRPKVEVEFLMSLFEREVTEELGSGLRESIRISVIGDTSKLSNSLQELISNVEESTKNNSRLQLIFAISYCGQYDIAQACKKIALKVQEGVLVPEDVNESLIEKELETNCTQFPNPDLLIRTSGELRISNFFLWQLAYTEMFFSQSLWPDFGEFEFLEAVRAFQCRQRRYGRNGAIE